MKFSTKNLRYGVIGVGMMGCEHIRNLVAIENCEVVAFADPHEPSRINAKKLVKSAVEYDDYQQMLQDENLDVVIIATPNHTHRIVLEACLRRGVHILVEKPVCINVTECREIIDIERQTHKAGRLVWVGLEYRYMAATSELIKEVESGTCGNLKMISIREHRFPFLQKVGNWNRFSKNTGGTLVEKCCHFFDLMTLLAHSAPVRVSASGAQDVNHLNEFYDEVRADILDNAFVIVDYQNGLRGMLDLSMFAEGSQNEQEICVVGDGAKIEALVTDSLIRIGRRASGRDGVVEKLVAQSSDVVQGFHGGASYVEHRRMQEKIRYGGESEVTLQDGLLSVAIGQAAHMSIAEGRIVKLAEILK